MEVASTWRRLRQYVGNTLFFLFVLVVVLDPTATVLNLKSKTFALLVAFNLVFMRPSFRFVPQIMMVYAAVAFAWLSGALQGRPCQLEDLVDTLLAFSPLLLLLWVHHYNLVRLTLFPAVLTACIVIAIFIFSSISPMYEGAIFYYMKDHNDMVMMTHRYILGFKLFGIYYKSFVCLVLPLFFFYYSLAHVKKRIQWLYVVPALLMTVAFFFSGTRATMLLPFFMVVMVGYRRVTQTRRVRYFLYPVIALGAAMFLILVVLLASERGEASNTIKFAHLISYRQLFDTHPLYFLLGEGLHTRFYSEGFHKLTFETEWTYVELIRCYGVASLLVLFTLLFPLYRLFRFRKSDYVLGVMASYVAYMLIAGTNPLLVSSSGMLVVLTAYCELCRQERTFDAGKEAGP